MKNRSLFYVISVLTPLVFSFAFALDIYIPAVPQMTQIFHTSQTAVQLTLSIFMLIVGIGQLIIGPISDQYGRRKLVLLSTLIYVIGSLLCMLALSIGMLIVARALQAFGGCGMLVIAFAIVRDCFSGNDSAKVYSFLNCGVGISPLVAPIIGSYLVVWFGWRAGFAFLALVGIIILLVIWFNVSETLPGNLRVKFDSTIFRRYWHVLTNRIFIRYVTSLAAAMAMFFTFFSSSPYIIIQLLHIPRQDFGYYFFLIGCMFFIGSLISGKIAGFWGAYKTNLFGTVLMTAAGVLMLVWYFIGGLSLINYLIPTMIAAIGGAFMMGSSAAGAMEPFAEIAGSAAALMGCIEFIVSAMIGTLVMHWQVHSTVPLAATMAILGLISLAMCLVRIS